MSKGKCPWSVLNSASGDTVTSRQLTDVQRRKNAQATGGQKQPCLAPLYSTLLGPVSTSPVWLTLLYSALFPLALFGSTLLYSALFPLALFGSTLLYSALFPLALFGLLYSTRPCFH
ncbi:hypothetical protein WMY93_021582 [Mugilogobius chulae]|uniref:Uncharacterized protein n=1 Tax=Mugilogobius chulae TaxID=88201 RepID=A0AAW0NB20_9GOBI